MITEVRELVSENPIEQIWRLLRFFKDEDYAIQRMALIHNLSDKDFKKHNSNLKKQAQQLAYCITQAEEYFHASSQVGLATRPLLLYYGMVSLSQALILLKQNGSYSLDVLRKEKKHSHHGCNQPLN